MSRITDLAAMTSLASGDLIESVDVDDTTMAATGTNKQLSIATLKTFIKAGPVNLASKPGAPTATASTAALVMMGLGSTWTVTPGSSGLVDVSVCFQGFTNTAAVQATFGARFGTGTAPVNGAAVTGTRWGANGDFVVVPPSTAAGVPISFEDLLTLTPGTAYWFDLCCLTSNASDTAQPKNICFVANEIS